MNGAEYWWTRSPYPDCDYSDFMNSAEADEDDYENTTESGKIHIRIDGDPFIFVYSIYYDEIVYATVLNEKENFQPERAEFNIPDNFNEAKFIAEAFIHKHAKYPWHKGESIYVEKDANFNRFARALLD